MRKKRPNILLYIITLRWLFIAPVLFYKKCLSPLLPNVCKYYPSCSTYMMDAIKRKGLIGVFLGIYRILRCNPFSKGGYDPVKAKRREYRWLY